MLPVIIGGHALSEYSAKMQSYPAITSCEVDTGVFQGANRSALQLLHNRRGARYLTCRIDFFGKDNYVRTRNQSEFEALFLGAEPVRIDIFDGYWYRAVLVEIATPYTERELITTVEYRFRVTRHRGEEIAAQVIPNDAKIWCHSNVAKTDCVIDLPQSGYSGDFLDIWLNGIHWRYSQPLSGDLVLDGVNKIFTVGGVNATNQIEWTDFPYLAPGENVLKVAVETIVVANKKAILTYTPTFL